MLQLFRRLRRHPKIQSVFFFAHNPPICGVARQNPLNRLRLWNSRRQPRVISSKQAPIAAPAQPPDTVRTAGCCEQEKRRFRRHPFILLSRRFLAAFSPRRPKSLDFDHFQRFPAFAASGFSRGHLVLFRCFLPTLPYSGATSGLQASGGYTLDCVLKVAQTADTGVTGWDWRFGCAFNLCSQ